MVDRQCHAGSTKLGIIDLHDTFPETINKQLANVCILQPGAQKTLTVNRELSSK